MPGTLTVKLIAVAIIVSVLGGLVYAWNNKEELICDLKTEVVVNKIESDSLKDTAKKSGIADKIEGEVRTDLGTNLSTIDKKQDTVKDTVDKKTNVVEKKYTDLKIKNSKTSTPSKMVEDTSERDTEISTIRIDGLWDQFCIDSPENKECKLTNQETK